MDALGPTTITSMLLLEQIIIAIIKNYPIVIIMILWRDILRQHRRQRQVSVNQKHERVVMPSSSRAVAAAAAAPILPSALYTAAALALALATEDELLEQLIRQSSVEDGGNEQGGTEEMVQIYLNRRK